MAKVVFFSGKDLVKTVNELCKTVNNTHMVLTNQTFSSVVPSTTSSDGNIYDNHIID